MLISSFFFQGGGQPALQYVASRVIGFVAVHCLWNVEVKQPMSEVWDSNMYGIKVHGWFLNVANEDGDAGDDGEGGDDDGDGGEDDGYGDEDDSDGGEDGDGGEDDATFASEDYVNEMDLCARGVQLLSIRANFRIIGINAYDWNQCALIYAAQIGEVQQEGMDLVLTGPYRMLQAYSIFGLEVFSYDIEGASTDDKGYCTSRIYKGWDVTEPDEVEEFTQTIYAGLGRKMEITYLVIPEAVETHFEVRLNLKDLGSRSRDVYGSIKASAIDYGGKSVPLFSYERGSSLSLPCGLWLHEHSSIGTTHDCIAISSRIQTPRGGGPKSNHNL